VNTKPGSADGPPAIQPGTETSRPEAGAPRNDPSPARAVERLFPFVMRAKILLVGRDKVRHSKGKLHFVLITEDIAENVRAEILQDFKHYPVVQHFMPADLENFFKIKGARTIGFAKSGLAKSIYAELKAYRINQPVTKSKDPAPPASDLSTK
jgi:hypothetical protein